MKKVLCLLLTVATLLLLAFTAGAAEVNIDPEFLCPWEENAAALAKSEGELRYYFMSSNGAPMGGDGLPTQNWGSACVIALPNGKTLLIDSGTQPYAPYLKENLNRLGFTKLDYVILTHAYADHCGGIKAQGGILDSFSVGRVYHSGYLNSSWESGVAEACAARSIPCALLKKGDTLTFGDVKLQILWPGADAVGQSGTNASQIANHSLTVRLDYGAHSSLFPGDLYAAGEQEVLTAAGTLLDTDLLHAPHHGEATSNSEAFLQAVTPELAVATGWKTVPGNVKNRYYNVGSRLLCDRENGYIRVIADDSGKMIYETDQIRATANDNAVNRAAVAMSAEGVFDGNGIVEAKCPVCNKKVQWYPLYQNRASGHFLDVTDGTQGHYYLTQNITYGGRYLQTANSNNQAREFCINLNGYTYNSSMTRGFMIRYNHTVNLMGYGAITGLGETENSGAKRASALDVLGTVNLYGGTYAGDGGYDIAQLRHSTAKINVYRGATLLGNENTPAVVRISNSGAQLTVDGGTVLAKGDYAVLAEKGTVNLYGESVIQNTQGSGLCLREKASLYAAQSFSGEVCLSMRGVSNVDYGKYLPGCTADPGCTGKLSLESHSNARLFITEEGKLKVASTAVVSAQERSWYASNEEAVAAADPRNYIKLYTDDPLELKGDTYVDINGHRVSVTGTGTLYGMDGTGEGRADAQNVQVASVVANPISGKQSIALSENDGYSFYPVQVSLTNVAIRPGSAGIYYKAKLTCDKALTPYVQKYGVALSVSSMPDDSFLGSQGRKDILYTQATPDLTGNNICSVVVENIITKANTRGATTPVYANAYVQLSVNGENLVILADTTTGDKTADSNFRGVAYSLKDIMQEAETVYANTVPASLKSFYGTWESLMKDWELPYVKAAYAQDPTGTQATAAFRVGYGRKKITPDDPVPLGGYGNSFNRISQNVLDDLYVTCTALQDNAGNTVLLLSQDLINSSAESQVRARISEATGIPVSHIVLAATHTHSAPDQGSDLSSVADWKPGYMEQCVKAAQEALEDLSAAYISVGSTQTEGLNFVRHYLMKDGTYAGDNFGNWSSGIKAHAEENDPELQVICFHRTAGDKQDVLLVNWQAHPCKTGGNEKYDISADFVGSTRSFVERETGMLFAYFTGAAGNQNASSRIKKENPTTDNTAFGELLGGYVLKATENMQTVHAGPVEITQSSYTGDIDQSMLDKLDQAKEVADLMAATDQVTANALAKEYGFSSCFHAKAVVSRANMGDTQQINISAVRVGDISFVTAPYEMFAAHGSYIKENTPYEMTFVVSCANGAQGYIPTNLAYDYGCYESHTGRFTRGTGDRLAETFVNMLKELEN